ncbi:transcription antitermination factor NusB [Opitutales bacterium]|jgi:transcription antitermination protein NusB|nr:transcription antitermination factor NusB [Opitutales bacterium]
MDLDLIINPEWSPRRQNRTAAFRFLYQWEINPPEDLNEELHEFLNKLEKNEGYFGYAIELVDGILDKLESIDSLINELVANWEFSRIAKTDLAILRLGIYEILYRLDVPPVVVIDEALEISKDFCSDNSRKFLNGVLDEASKRSGRPNRQPSV